MAIPGTQRGRQTIPSTVPGRMELLKDLMVIQKKQILVSQMA